jgi:serine/threonine-protein kinase
MQSRITSLVWLLVLGELAGCSGSVGGSQGEAGADAASSDAGNSPSSGGSKGSGGRAGTAGTTGNASGGGGASAAGRGSSSAVAGKGSGGAGGSAGRGSGGVSGTAGAAAGSGGSGTAGQQPGSGKLVDGAIFYQDVHGAALDAESSTLISALQSMGWGDAGHRTTLGIDFSFEINQADTSVARRAFTQPADALPDCDTAPVPLVPGGKTEGAGDYACSGGDCHLLVYQGTRLYELYQADVTGGQATGGTFTGTCLVVWDLTKDYWKPAAPPNFSRGDHCNGADAGDMPIAPLLLTADEISAGEIPHALRFTISNNRIRAGVYVHPATHIGGPSGGSNTLPYGSRLRLRSDYPLASLPNDAARTVARALQTYGMFLADGGNIYISATTGAADAIGGSALTALTPSDFEMIEGGDRIPWSGYQCTRTPISD